MFRSGLLNCRATFLPREPRGGVDARCKRKVRGADGEGGNRGRLYSRHRAKSTTYDPRRPTGLPGFAGPTDLDQPMLLMRREAQMEVSWRPAFE